MLLTRFLYVAVGLIARFAFGGHCRNQTTLENVKKTLPNSSFFYSVKTVFSTSRHSFGRCEFYTVMNHVNHACLASLFTRLD